MFNSVSSVLNKIDQVPIAQVRDSIIKSSEMIEDLKMAAKQMLPPLHGVGGTAIGGYEPL